MDPGALASREVSRNGIGRIGTLNEVQFVYGKLEEGVCGLFRKEGFYEMRKVVWNIEAVNFVTRIGGKYYG